MKENSYYQTVKIGIVNPLKEIITTSKRKKCGSEQFHKDMKLLCQCLSIT